MTDIFQLRGAEEDDYLDFGFPEAGSVPLNDEPAPAPKSRGRPKKSTTVPRGKAQRVEEPLDWDFPEQDIPMRGEKKPNIKLKNVQEHQNLINTLNGYASSQRFRPILDSCGVRIRDLETKSIAELKELRERVRACCLNSGGTGIVSKVALMGCGTLEKVVPKRLANLDGYTMAVANNPEFHALAEMIELDSGFRTSMTPMQRMMWCLGSTAASVAAQNNMKAKAMGQQDLLASLRAQRELERQQQAAVNIQPEPAVMETASSLPQNVDSQPPGNPFVSHVESQN